MHNKLTHNELAVGTRGRNLAEMMNPSTRNDSRTAFAAVFGLSLPLFFAAAAFGQSPASRSEPLATDKSQALDGLKVHDQELEAARDKQRKSI